MSWISSRLDDRFVVYRVAEVRLTQGKAKLRSVGVSLATSSQRFTSRFITPEPVDPLSHRNKVCWTDSEVKVSIDSAKRETVKVAISNRRRRLRTVIGTTEFTLLTLDPPKSGSEPFKRTLCVETALLPTLNLKIDLVVELQSGNGDGWQQVLGISGRRNSLLSLRGPSPPPLSLPQPKIDRLSLQGVSPSSSSASVRNSSYQGAATPSGSDSALSSLSPRSSSQGPAGSEQHQSGSIIKPTGVPIPADAVDGASVTRSETNSVASEDSMQSSATSIGMAKEEHTAGRTGFGFDINSDTVGVVFMEIVNVANLPRFRTLTGISFDMDPFVIMSFGRRVYKTPHRRHTTNPTFNCKVAFEVGKSETNFDIVFTVWDQDKITLNDRVARAELPVLQIIRNQAPKVDPLTNLYDLENHGPSVMVIPLAHQAGTSEMVIKVYYYPMAAIRQQMWRGIIALYDEGHEAMGPEHHNNCSSGLTLPQLKSLLNALGSTLGEDTVRKMFLRHELDPAHDRLSEDQTVIELEHLVESMSAERVILFRICPICRKKNPSSKKISALQHLSVCASRHWSDSSATLLDKKYVSSQQASKRWYANFLSKFSYGSYQIGAHSANILVQDRISGQISEERMSTSVRLAIRVIYSLGPVERRRFQRLLKRYTLRQGEKYSSPASASSIEPFIKFHNLDMSEVLQPVSSFKTFNEFFYRKLKPGSRPCENADEPGTAVSMADCRLTAFPTIDTATKLWIKGRYFSVERLIGSTYPEDAKRYTNDGTIIIFRLAPQDYHRVHSPVDGVMGEPRHINGHYYTVNPMAVRSSLDVFGENVRTVFPIDSPEFGRVMIVMVGAMMVGSCVVTREPGDQVKRTEELGYFQFGGSTVVALFEKNRMVPDSDLLANSSVKIETLVKVGMSIGHTAEVPEYVRSYDTRLTTISRARTHISGGGSYLPFSLD